MGFEIRLEDEFGNKVDAVGDPANFLPRLLPSPEDESFICLRFIDPYGDTVFNRIQIETFVVEIERILMKTVTSKERQLLENIQALAERCRSEPHSYVKFYGD